MRYPTSYQKALNAAKSVVYGTRKNLGVTAVGLALIASPACSSSQSGNRPNTNKADTTVVATDTGNAAEDAGATNTDTGTQAAEDAGTATGAQDVAKTGEDGVTIEDAGIINVEPDAGPVVVDAADTPEDTGTPSTTDIAQADAGTPNKDAGETCLKTCYQPTGQKCVTPTDCNVPETLGKCANNAKECKPGDCDKDVACEGYKPAFAAQVDPDGKAPGWAPINCLDGECQHGQALSQAASECCSLGWQNFCEDTQYTGCSPWGPPAPPQFDGRRLKDLLKAVA